LGVKSDCMSIQLGILPIKTTKNSLDLTKSRVSIYKNTVTTVTTP